MNLRNLIFVCFCAILTLIAAGCGEESATTRNLSKENSVEIVVSTKHINEKYDLIKTTRRVYLENKLIKESSSFDTVPALGRVQVEDDEDKNVKVVQKDYDIFVTVQ